MRILVPVDGSTHSITAMKHLIEHVGWFRDAPVVDLVCVQPPLPTRLVHSALTAGELESYYQDEANRELAMAKVLLAEAGIATTSHVVVGEAAESIVDLARKAGADLILMAMRGNGQADRPPLGSTTGKVLHLSNGIPVFVVNPGTT